MGHFENKKHVIDFKTGQEPKMAGFDFGAFQKQMHMPSRAKYLLHILFGAFQETSRMVTLVKNHKSHQAYDKICSWLLLSNYRSE